jgi:hypothetical protein
MPTGTKGDYEVGYGKPPRGAGFKKSQSGNPRGCGLLPLRPLTQLKANGPFLYRRDHTPRCVALLDQISGGRFLFGIGGGGWNQEEIENHDTVFATRMRKMREQIEAMRAIWTKPKYHGELRFRHDYDPAEAGAEAASTRYPRRRLSVGGAAGDPLWQRLVSERCERQSRGIRAGLPQDGAGRWARSGLSAGHDRWRARLSRQAETVS